MWGRLEITDRLRPVDLVAPGFVSTHVVHPPHAPREASYPLRVVAPYAAVTASLRPTGDGRLALWFATGDGVRLCGEYDVARQRFALEVTGPSGVRQVQRSRRHGRASSPVDAVALTLTGTHLTVLSHEGASWTARGRVDLSEVVDTRNEAFVASLSTGHSWHPADSAAPAPVDEVRCGPFGQLGFRDVRFVTHRDGSPVRDDGLFWLTATHAGPGFFDTGHTGVWSFDPERSALTHRADLFFRRLDRPGVYGDHATHLLRDGERWLVATSTWGDFDAARPGARVQVTLADTTADLLAGQHVLDTRLLPLPVGALERCVGVWDPHLVHADGLWHVGFVAATKFFRFHPALATGARLDELDLAGADPTRTATEGVVLTRLGDELRMLASDGRQGRRSQRERFPVFDLAMTEIGELDAPYPSNIPWPNLAPYADGWLWVTFNGTPYGGDLLGYGTHGELLVGRSTTPRPTT